MLLDKMSTWASFIFRRYKAGQINEIKVKSYVPFYINQVECDLILAPSQFEFLKNKYDNEEITIENLMSYVPIFISESEYNLIIHPEPAE